MQRYVTVTTSTLIVARHTEDHSPLLTTSSPSRRQPVAMSTSVGVESFSPVALEEFQTYLQTSTNRTIFDPAKRAKYRNWLCHPDAQVSKMLPKKERSRVVADRYRALQGFLLKDN